MPSSNLFAVSNQGRVFTLQTDQSIWKELPYLGIDFKRVSAHDSVVWALGGDHQVYVFVYGTSVPIRVCEETYENQRWNPVEGFTRNLLLTDRPSFSSADGLTDRTLASIHLPSLAWNWEGPWHLQDTYEGKALDKECWTYAMDFPRTFSADKKWNSCVRRRKWIRYRRYTALDTWSSVSPIHKDHTEEPFIDICVGGGEVVGEDSDRLMVWGITALGKVMVREGICSTCPEGSKWSSVSTPINQDLTSLSISRSGRVWAVTWDGCALVRKGISRECPLGVGWSAVQPPENIYIHQIAAGVNVVWALCRDSSVWFRRGLTDDECSLQQNLDNSDVGTSWLQMVGSLIMISIGPNDQIWALAADDHSMVIRTGVTSSELSGKMWKIISLSIMKFDPDRYTEDNFTFQDDSDSEENQTSQRILESTGTEEQRERLSSQQDSESQDAVSMNFDSSLLDQSSPENVSVLLSEQHSPPCIEKSLNKETESLSVDFDSQTCLHKSVSDGNAESEHPEALNSSEFSNLKIKNPEEISDSLNSSVISDTVVNFIGPDYSPDDSVPAELRPSESAIINPREEQLVNADLHAVPVIPTVGSSSSSIDSKLNIKSGIDSTGSSISSEVLLPKIGQGSLSQEEEPFYGISIPEENLWMWVSGGGCWINPNYLPKWFIAEYSNFTVNEPWRQCIVEQLNERKKKYVKDFLSYGEAIESSSWVITGQCRYLTGGYWVPASVELQMVGSRRCQIQEASLTIIYTSGSKKKILIPCCSVVLYTLTVDLPAKAVVSLFTSNQPLSPLPLLFSAEKDAEEWINHISSACTQYRGLDSRPSPCTVWAITSQGFIYVHDLSSSETEMKIESTAAHHVLDIEDGRTPVLRQLHRGFRPGCFVTVKGRVLEEAKRLDINLMLDEQGTNIALHFNPRFHQKAIVMNTKENGVWSYEERESLRSIAKNKEYEFTILCDDRDMKISVNGGLIYRFNHRLMPGDISFVKVDGDFTVSGIVYNYGAGERTMQDFFWQGVGGHLRVIEGGAGGVTWGVSYDSHVYSYTGGTGGGIYKGNSHEAEVNVMSDIRHFYVWENQRWNPVTGFTYRGLPTDRNTWSDQSGRHPRTKEGTKLPSRHWQWISDWAVDHHTPGGVDKDGWQYATDFPMSYHGHRYVTDLVRRRRWMRKCRVSTSGPWKQMEKVMLISVSVSPHASENGTIPVWGVSFSNEVVMREGVTPSCVEGTRWSLIPSETPMKEICAGIECGVWAISCIGQAHFRLGVTAKNPKGYDWVNVDAPTVPLKQIAFGKWRVWAIDKDGSLYYRMNVQPLFPEGTAWCRVSGGVERITVSADGILWVILQSFTTDSGESVTGVMARRNGVANECPGGTSWDICTGTGWSHVSARMALP